MKPLPICVCSPLAAGILFAQNDRGTITGTVADPAVHHPLKRGGGDDPGNNAMAER